MCAGGITVPCDWLQSCNSASKLIDHQISKKGEVERLKCEVIKLYRKMARKKEIQENLEKLNRQREEVESSAVSPKKFITPLLETFRKHKNN